MTSFGNGTVKGMAQEMPGRSGQSETRTRSRRRLRTVVASIALIAMASPALAGSGKSACEAAADGKAPDSSKIIAQTNLDTVPRGEQAKAVRFLQSELMVAALACNARQNYGEFVKRYKVSLVSSGHDLKNHFEKAHGQKKGFAELNRFVTRMANKASGRMASLGASFCADMHATYERLLSDEKIPLAGYSLGYRAQVESKEMLAVAECVQPEQVSALPQ